MCDLEGRIQKIISALGEASRRAAEKMIEEGRVTVNGRVARLGESMNTSSDTLCIDGRPLDMAPLDKKAYIMLNKPQGFVTTVNDEKGRNTVMDLVAHPLRLFPVGRLDYNSEGLLILTNDGDFANTVMHPKNKVKKKYEVLIPGIKYNEDFEPMKTGMIYEGERYSPAEVQILSHRNRRTLVEITISEGKNHQVRNMCAACGMDVANLKRVSYGPLVLGRLKVGGWRNLSASEVGALMSAASRNK